MDCIEICAGAGGQALGLEKAGFSPALLVEWDDQACQTLLRNRPAWDVRQLDVRAFSGNDFAGVALFAGGVPCPPFSVAGKQLGPRDERDLFPEALRLVSEIRPAAVMLENVRGLLDPRFADYRKGLVQQFKKLGYHAELRLLNASEFGVPQLRPRVVIVALRNSFVEYFSWPLPRNYKVMVGDCLFDLLSAHGWPGAQAWRRQAQAIAPTIVGGSKKHGGPDLGPTRAKRAWAQLGIDGMGIADQPPGPLFQNMPRLTVPMVARLQGFPDDWIFVGKKTSAYRQVGNAFPPPVAFAVAEQIHLALAQAAKRSVRVAG